MKIFKKLLLLCVVVALMLSAVSCAAAPTIGENGNWFINGEDTGVYAGGVKGDKGEDGKDITILSFKKEQSSGLIDTYRLVFSDKTSTLIQVTNGVTPEVSSFKHIATSNDGEATYELGFSDGSVAALLFSNGKDGKDGVNTVENLGFIYSNLFGGEPISAEVATLTSGSSLKLEENFVLNNKQLTASFSFDSLGEESVIALGHGRSEYAATYIKITKDNLIICDQASTLSTREIPHGLKNIGGYMRVIIDVGQKHRASIQIFTPGNEIFKVSDVSWCGRNGEIFISPANLNLADVKLTWSSDDFKNDIYMLGDSYFSATDPARWTTHLINNGYTNNCMMGYPGMASADGIKEFKRAIAKGTPKFAFWCMGMNNGDSNGEINASYLAATEEFLALCEERGITPILATIPSTPTVDNTYKNEWVRNKNETEGIRFVDFAKAVGGDVKKEENYGKTYVTPKGQTVTNTNGYDWYDGMLYPDLVHPAKLGAEALYMQAIIDFPELMQK